jgi:hypothetical protein
MAIDYIVKDGRLFMKKIYPSVLDLLRSELRTNEETKDAKLIQELQTVRQRAYLNQEEFLKICFWKDPRQLRRKDWTAHSDETLMDTSKRAFAQTEEAQKILWLCRLKGVGVPVASAILTLCYPEQYGVIDIRIWQLLHAYGEVDYDEQGDKLTVLHWLDYLPKIRSWAKSFETQARLIELTLFEHHKQHQEGTLYRNPHRLIVP